MINLCTYNYAIKIVLAVLVCCHCCIEILPALAPEVLDLMELSTAEEAEAESEDHQKEEVDWKIQVGDSAIEADALLLSSGRSASNINLSLLYREITTPPPELWPA